MDPTRPDGPAALAAALEGCSAPLAAYALALCADCREHHGGWCLEDLTGEQCCPAGPLWRPSAEAREEADLGPTACGCGPGL